MARGDDVLWLGLAAVAGVGLYLWSRPATATTGGGGGAFAAVNDRPYFTPDAPGIIAGWYDDALDFLGARGVSDAGVQFIARQESFSATPYWDATGWAIGYGHHVQDGETFPAPITEGEGLALMAADLAPVESAINSNVMVALDQNQFDALASLIYNIGVGAFQRSTLLQVLNAGDYQAAAEQFPQWNRSGGSVNSGLVNRRADEWWLFNT